MTTGQIEDFASVDVFYGRGLVTLGNSIVFEAYLGDDLVASDEDLLSSSGLQHDTLIVRDVQFDTLTLRGEGPEQQGIFLGSIDNVRITPEPSTLSTLLLLSILSLVVGYRHRARQDSSLRPPV